MKRRAGALATLCSLLIIGAGSVAAEPTFTPWTPPQSGPDHSALAPNAQRLPLWWDVTMDGHPDLLFAAIEGIERVQVSPDGTLGVQPVSLSPSAQETLFAPDQQAGVDTKDLVFATLDADGDGVNELLAVGRRTDLWRLSGPSEVTRSVIPLPPLRTRGINDAAVGDLNRDGRPDIYLAIGTAYPERLNLRGHPDVVLMNRGDGRFEAIEVAPKRNSVTNGVTLADVDGDGWLDAIESVDASTIAGPSRLLFNRTALGDTEPHFVPSEHRWDPGTDGMGAAVGDLDQDGVLDLYNTSIGMDLLMMGQGGGVFVDETTARGIHHAWSSLGARIQWSPSFADLNLDGRLDIVVRHGITESFANSTATYSWASDLLYTQGADGKFSRAAVPSEVDAGGGRNFVIGDVDQDGRPDLARDGRTDDVLLWQNTTSVPAEAPHFGLHLIGTVSGSPPTGTYAIGQCGAQSLTRHLTSGGKMGAPPSPTLFFAFPDCGDDVVNVSVHWPSGAISALTVDRALTHVSATEPMWAVRQADGGLLLDPEGTGAQQACAATTEGPWTCCESPCVVDTAEQPATRIKLDDHLEMALPAKETAWLWITTPSLARPGEEVTVQLLHVGPPEDFDGEELSLYLDDGLIPWSDVDQGARKLSAELSVASDAWALNLGLRRGQDTLSTSQPSVGYLVDAERAVYDLYPTRPAPPMDEGTRWVLHLHTPPGVYEPELISKLTLSRSDGTEVPIAALTTDGAMRRVSLEVDWTDLVGVDSVWLRDREGGPALELPVAASDEGRAQGDTIEGLSCGLQRSTLRTGGHDASGVLVTAFGPGGHPMLVPSSDLEVEVQGGDMTTDVITFAGLMDMFFRVQGEDVVGPGLVTVRNSSGSQSATCGFQSVDWQAEPVALERSWATISATTIGSWSFDTARLRIGVMNTHGELMGATTWPQVILSGGEWARELVLTDAGTLTGDIRSNGTSDTLRVTVTVDARVLEAFEVEVTGLDSAPEPAPPSGPTTSEDDGCASRSGHRGSRALWLALLLFAATRWRCRASLPARGAEVA
ncbi:MAG: FG-GAP repeat domain-containing protein [Myxococcota bacterium]